MLDGVDHGQIGPDDDLTVQTTAGKHEVYVTTDGRVRSKSLTIELSPGQRARILSSSPSNPVGNLFRIIFHPAETIEIELLKAERPEF
jgi:hypothetical protein